MDDPFRLQRIFAPHEHRRREALLRSGKRLVHYTSAAAAISVIRNKAVWMRNVRCMNDFMEVEHGFRLMLDSIKPPVDTEIERGLARVARSINDIFPGIMDEATKIFDSWLDTMRHETYVTCLSEHDKNEDLIGRLSMWRSYTSQQVGVAFVINPFPLYSLSTTFGAFSSPVYYLNEPRINEILFEIGTAIENERKHLEERGRDASLNHLFF